MTGYTLRKTWQTSLLVISITGCNGLSFTWDRKENKKHELGVGSEARENASSPAVRDTIGALAYYEGLTPMRVRGYGLIVGLNGNGSRDCPDQVYKSLVQSMYKQFSFTSTEVGVKATTPEELINSLDTAVVVVYGEIPAAAMKGDTFDVRVDALPGTSTKSLRGGKLFPTELELFRTVSGGRSISGKTLAMAAGPVFVNPFSEEGAATRVNPLSGLVLGGGRNSEDRRIRLVLTEPSYQVAQRIQDRINNQFPGPSKVADAISPSFIQVVVPNEHRKDTGHFLSLLRSLYLSSDPTFETRRAQELARALVHPESLHADIALCFEGIGREALPVLKDLYLNPKGHVNFHAAVAGIRLGDHLACDVLAMHAINASSEFRFGAIRGLAEAKGMAPAAIALRGLLSDRDPRVRVAVYEALVERGESALVSREVGMGNYVLHTVPAEGDAMVYIKRSREARIALFGGSFSLHPPIFYSAPDDTVTLNARDGEDTLTVIRQIASTDRSSPPLHIPLDLENLIQIMGNKAQVDSSGEVTGLGLDYAAVVRAVYQLCQDRAVHAIFQIEQPNVAELFGPSRPAGRPESEL